MAAFGAKPLDSQDADDPTSWFSGLDWLKPQATKLQGSSPTAAARGSLRPLTSNTGRGAQPNQLLQQATAVSKVHARRPRPAASLPSLGPKTLLQQQQHAVPVHTGMQPASVFDCFPGDESDRDSETQQERTATNHKPAASRTISSSKHTLQHSSFDLDLFGSKAVGARQQQQQQQPNKSTAATFSRLAHKEAAAAAAASDGPTWLQPLGMPAARLPDTTTAACGRGGGSKQQTNRSSLPVFTLPGPTAADRPTAPKAAAAAGCQVVPAQGELELVLLSPGESAWDVDADNSLGSLQHQQQEGEREGHQQTSKRGAPAAAAAAGAQGKMGSGSRQFTDLSAQQRQQQLAACKQSKFLSEFDYAADSQGDVPEGSQGDGVGADSSGYSDSQSDSLSDADSASDSDGAAADAAASHSSGSLWSGSSGGGGSSSGDAGSADDSDVSFVAEGSRKRKQTGQGVPGLKRPRQQQVAAAAKAAHKAVRFADEDGKGLEAGDLQQQWKQQQQQKAAQHRSSSSSLKAGSSNAARSRSVLELGAVLPGEVPLLLPSGANLTRSNILLVELPAGFDAEGDAGAIGRVICNPAGPRAGAAAAAAAADGPAVARVAGRLQDRKRRTASNKPVAAAGTAAAGGSDGDTVSSDTLSDSSSSAGGSKDGSQGCSGHTDRGAQHDAGTAAAAVPVLDLKGTIYDLQELLLAGTAAVVRINAPGKGAAAAGKPGPAAHMEHLLGSFVRAVPSAAAAGADQDYSEAFEFGLLDADEDVFGVGADAGGVGGEEGGGGGRVGSRAGGRGRGRGGGGGAGKNPRPRAGGHVSGLGALGLGGGARKGKGVGGRARGGGRGGKRKSAAGRKPAGAKAAGGLAARNAAARAAPEAGGGKGSSKAKKKKPWETHSDVDGCE